MKIKFLLFAITFAAFTSQALAQSSGSYGLPKKKDFDRLSVGLSVGMNWFQGDLADESQGNNGFMENLTFPVAGIKVGYQLTHTTQLNFRGYYTKLEGTKKNQLLKFPNPSSGPWVKAYTWPEFESPVMQATLNANFTFGNISFLQRNKRFHFFGELGAGIFTFQPKLTDTHVMTGLDTFKDTILIDKDMQTGVVLPLGLGAKYQIKRFDIGLMVTYNKTLTDRIDWADDAKTESDNYSFYTLNINYTIGKKQAMMEWVNPMEVVYSDMADLKDKMDVLSGDKDKDGVSDLFDKDNSTAEGTRVYGDGTAVDTDGDGIPDSKDTDPYSGKGVKVDANGMELDADGDGVPDSRDLEPNTAKGNIVNFQGISLGTKPGDASASAMAASWLPSVFFDVDKYDIKPAYRDRLNTIAKIMKNNPDLKIKITGNTDADAGEAYNEKLGMNRAEACKKHLVKVYGIDETRLTTETRGETEQMAKGIKLMNRRVDFSVAK